MLSPESELYLRVTHLTDLEAMVNLEKEVWDEDHAASSAIIERRLRVNPGCTIGAFTGESKQLAGFFTLLATSTDRILVLRAWDYYAELANKTWESSEVHYGISLTVSKNAPRGTGSCIMQAAREYSRVLGAKKIIVVTRAPSFHKMKSSMSFEQYYELLLAGGIKEPLYFLMCSAGWKPVGYCTNYYSDSESADHGLRFEA
jgi:hypothetical protein